MTKSDKRLGRPHRKSAELPEPREMKPIKRTKKPPPRYAAQRWVRDIFCRWPGEWWDIGSSKSLEQAIAMMGKDRGWDQRYGRESITRVLDRETGQVVAGYKKPVPYNNPKKEAKEASNDN